jgi:cytochrome c oxidase assembly protein subunit 11
MSNVAVEGAKRQADLERAKRRSGIFSVLLVAGMVAAAYASVPLYRIFCQVTGFGGTTNRANLAAVPDAATMRALAGRTIKIRFDSNMAPGMVWRFAPKDREQTIKIGEKRMAYFVATSNADVPTTGRAIFNVSPDTAGKYFRKIACFCFTEQTLGPRETVDMPVTYFVDPEILNDPDASKIDEITLSYTFFPVDNPAPKPVSASASANRG